MERDYAEQRAEVLRQLDGLRVEVDAERKIGYLILDRPPLNIVSYKARSQIRAIIEAFDEDDDVGVVVIKGANGETAHLTPLTTRAHPATRQGLTYHYDTIRDATSEALRTLLQALTPTSPAATFTAAPSLPAAAWNAGDWTPVNRAPRPPAPTPPLHWETPTVARCATTASSHAGAWTPADNAVHLTTQTATASATPMRSITAQTPIMLTTTGTVSMMGTRSHTAPIPRIPTATTMASLTAMKYMAYRQAPPILSCLTATAMGWATGTKWQQCRRPIRQYRTISRPRQSASRWVTSTAASQQWTAQ